MSKENYFLKNNFKKIWLVIFNCSIFASQLTKALIKSKKSGSSSVGRARPCQGRGREFESRFPLSFQKLISGSHLKRWLFFWLDGNLFYFCSSYRPGGGMVDTQDLKSCELTLVRVRVPPGVRKQIKVLVNSSFARTFFLYKSQC